MGNSLLKKVDFKHPVRLVIVESDRFCAVELQQVTVLEKLIDAVAAVDRK